MVSDFRLLTADQFGAELEAHLHGLPQVEVLGRNQLELRLRIGQRNINSQADAFYSAYVSAPQRMPEIIEAYAKLISEELPIETPVSFDELVQRVYPMIKRPDILVQVRERNIPMLAWTPFLADLIVTYVIDNRRSVSYINEEHLERWEIGEQKLHEHALRNLRHRTADEGKVTVVGEAEQRLYIYSTLDGYDATRLLLPDVLGAWQPALSGKIVIGIPNRDFLIGFGDADAGILSAVARQVQLDAASRDHGLTEQLFTITNGRVEEYEW